MEEGEVVVGFAVAAGRDAAFGFEPGVGAFDRPAVAGLRVGGFQPAFLAAPDLAGLGACGDRLAAPARLADAGLDPPLADRLLEFGGGIAAVGPALRGQDPACGERVEQRQRVAPLVFAAARQPDRERLPESFYGQVVAATRLSEEGARDLLAPFFASTVEASTITRDQSSFPAAAKCSCKTTIAASSSPRRDHSSSRRRQVSPLGRSSSR